MNFLENDCNFVLSFILINYMIFLLCDSRVGRNKIDLKTACKGRLHWSHIYTNI